MFQISSSAFEDGKAIPKKFTQEGENISPALGWTDVPQSAQELALICEDPDAPNITPYIHWVIYNIDPRINSLPQGVSSETKSSLESSLVSRAKQGKNSSGKIGYIGPMPPKGHGWHRYYFRLFALDQKLDLEAGLSASDLLERIRNHVIAEAEIVGRYQRVSELSDTIANETRP